VKKIIPWILLAGVLIVIGVVSGRRSPGGGHTDVAAAWEAYERGNEHLLAFQFDAAGRNLRQAVELDPGFAMAHAALAQLRRQIGEYDGFVTEVATADSLAGQMDNDLERLEVQVRLSNYDISKFHAVADSLLAAGKDRDPDNLVFLDAAARRAEYSRDAEQVERMWQRILEVNPNFASAYNNLGYLYLNQGRYVDAESALRRYAFLAPDLANPHDSLGEMLMTVGRYPEAEEQFKLALTKQPEFFHSLVNLALIYLNQGRVDKSLGIIDQVLAQIGSNEFSARILQRTANTLFLNDLETAGMRYLDRLLASDAEVPFEPIYRAAQLIHRERPAEAVALLDSAVTAWNEEPEFAKSPRSRASVEAARHRLIGSIASRRGDDATAMAEFEQALVFEDKAGRAPHERIFSRLHLARSAHALGLDDVARDQLRQIFVVNPLLGEPLVLAVRVALAQNDRTTAARYLELLDSLLAQADQDFPAAVQADLLRSQLTVAD